MKIKATYRKYLLQFILPAGTSRGTYTEKSTWYLFLSDKENPGIIGVGECNILKDLSIDDVDNYEGEIQRICNEINASDFDLQDPLYTLPSIRFGLDTALLDLEQGGTKDLFPGSFTKGETGISTNGLIWMGSVEFMERQIAQKIASGFRCIKMKIGATDWESERRILSNIRKQYSASELTLRVDANGAYTDKTVYPILNDLARLDVHSIEQPIPAGNRKLMAQLCNSSPVPIALDEELIGISTRAQKTELVEYIKPQYLILKPALIGGFRAAEEWITLAEKQNIQWWATSALESNIGLNAISQWVATKINSLPQGLGLGSLYQNNIPSPLTLVKDKMYYLSDTNWDLKNITDA